MNLKCGNGSEVGFEGENKGKVEIERKKMNKEYEKGNHVTCPCVITIEDTQRSEK